MFRYDMSDGFSQSPLKREPDDPRPRSTTLCSSRGDTIKKELKEMQIKRREQTESKKDLKPEIKPEKISSPTLKSPIMDM
jgi:hypothetical protein